MNLQRSAEIQVVLEGVTLPATREELVRYAARFDEDAARELEAIPKREYGRIDEVGDELAATAVVRPTNEQLPQAESGKPPGGDDYLRPFPEPGTVHHDAPRDHPPQEPIEEASKTQKRQKAKEGG
jgi:hypothetical protein